MSKLPPVEYLKVDAEISADELYRYTLSRVWDETLPVLVFTMLNPSKAAARDARGRPIDDPTIRKCVGFARRLGYGGILVVNLFAWRSTAASGLRGPADPVGPKNYLAIMNCIKGRDVIAAWGVHVRDAAWMRERARAVLATLRDHAKSVSALTITDDGIPCHPLMLAYALSPVPFGSVFERVPPPAGRVAGRKAARFVEESIRGGFASVEDFTDG